MLRQIEFYRTLKLTLGFGDVVDAGDGLPRAFTSTFGRLDGGLGKIRSAAMIGLQRVTGWVQLQT